MTIALDCTRYHVPRSFLNNGDNTLVLFEEFGGDPSNVSFQTITVGTVCGNAYEGSTLELSCQGGSKIMGIEFASFGDHHESCGSFSKGSSEAINTLSIVQKVKYVECVLSLWTFIIDWIKESYLISFFLKKYNMVQFFVYN